MNGFKPDSAKSVPWHASLKGLVSCPWLLILEIIWTYVVTKANTGTLHPAIATTLHEVQILFHANNVSSHNCYGKNLITN